MISRIYVVPRSWQFSGGHSAFASYLLRHELSDGDLGRIAVSLTNPTLEKFYIDQFPKVSGFNYVVEIGFKPGVTDNAAHTVKEIVKDMLHLPADTILEVFSSKVYLFKSKPRIADLYNPLIERSYTQSLSKVSKIGLPKDLPEVILRQAISVNEVSLKITDDELLKIGTEGIRNQDGSRRGPLALDLLSMKTIADYFAKLRRNPTDVELESLAQTWSEHCKHTIFANPIDDIEKGLYKTYIKGATNLIRKKMGKKDFCVSVFSDNAGGIVFDKDYLITHKVETHNSPSALDPFGGAITGIVGVNRDTIGFGLGAKPVANTYGFCFGNPEDARPIYRDKDLKQKMLPPKRIMEGVIKGINTGGNCSGIPTLSGFVKYDDRYKGKPLVFAGTVGLIPRKINGRFSHEKKAEPGDYIVMVGGRVGADGIHGATFSSVTMDANSPATAVQIGDPITQKKLSDAIVKEARAMDLYNSITDNGAGGISCSVAEMAKECGGARVELEKVPLKYPGLEPWQIWISESQERMTLSVPPAKWNLFERLMQSRGVEATAIGQFTSSGKCVVTYNGRAIMDLELEFLHNGLPKRDLKTIKATSVHKEPRLPNSTSRTKMLEKLLAEKNISGFSFISQQYDHEVQASSVVKPLSGAGRINTDAQVFRPVLSSTKGVVLSLGTYPSYGDISTYHMSACAIDTAVRNIIAAGGTLSHLAILDNFCWCSSYDKERLGQLVESLRACREYAVGYSTPFISGKDSMFNDFKGYDEKSRPIKISIPPTLLISAIGVLPDLYKAVTPEFKSAGDVIYLLGETHDELGGGEYFKMLGYVGNNVPKVNLKKNLKTYKALEKAIEKELIASSLSITSGGLGVALAKASVGGMLGCSISLAEVGHPQACGCPTSANSVDVKLFSESQGRILVSINPRKVKSFEKIVKNIPHKKLGVVQKGGKFVISDKNKKVVRSSIKTLAKAYHSFSNKMS